MRGYRGFTRTGVRKRSKSGARLRRIVERADRDGWKKRLNRSIEQHKRWEKSFQNVLARDKNGDTYWAMDRSQLIHKGRKP